MQTCKNKINYSTYLTAPYSLWMNLKKALFRHFIRGANNLPFYSERNHTASAYEIKQQEDF